MQADGNSFPEFIWEWTTGLARRWKPIIIAVNYERPISCSDIK